MTVLDGLEVKVAFGDVWKKSLTELSGGQRSVILHTKNNYRDLIRNSQVFYLISIILLLYLLHNTCTCIPYLLCITSDYLYYCIYRSLVALSLILSLLLFKPAPLYILDEVDAALDLSHTQNIGQMLRTHFHHSQFIVVSLKNGMFNNANVLFKTKFVDGVSTVTR